MEIYLFIRGTMAWTVTVAALWPFNVPLAALAYKIRQGPKPIDMPRKEFWLRSTLAALTVAGFTLVMVWLDNLLCEADFPAGPIHLVVFLAYIPTAVWALFWFFALEDLMQGLSLFVIYIYLPVLALYPLNALIGFWQPLVDVANGWLKVP